jgi:hypothetical protein
MILKCMMPIFTLSQTNKFTKDHILLGKQNLLGRYTYVNEQVRPTCLA